MEKITLAQIVKSNDIQDIEKHLAYSFVVAQNINISKNKFLKKYFDGFVPNDTLLSQIKLLGHTTIGEISVDMELLIPGEDRKVNGAFFTPSYIVDYILEYIAPNAKAKIVDASCGSGAFLLGTIRYMKKKHNKSTECLWC